MVFIADLDILQEEYDVIKLRVLFGSRHKSPLQTPQNFLQSTSNNNANDYDGNEKLCLRKEFLFLNQNNFFKQHILNKKFPSLNFRFDYVKS